MHAAASGRETVHSQRRQQYPLNGLAASGRLQLGRPHDPQREGVRGHVSCPPPGCLDPHGTGGELQDRFPFRLTGFARDLDPHLTHHRGLPRSLQHIARSALAPGFDCHPPGLTHPYDQRDMDRPRGHQKGKHLGLAILHQHYAGPVRQRLRHPRQPRQPLLTLFFCHRPGPALGRRPKRGRIPRPALLAQQPQGSPFGRQRQRRMQQQPPRVRIPIDRPQPPRPCVGGIIHLGGILGHDYLGVRLTPLGRLFPMASYHLLHAHLLSPNNPTARLPEPRPTSCRKGLLGPGQHLFADPLQTAAAALIPDFHACHLRSCPALFHCGSPPCSQ